MLIASLLVVSVASLLVVLVVSLVVLLVASLVVVLITSLVVILSRTFSNFSILYQLYQNVRKLQKRSYNHE